MEFSEEAFGAIVDLSRATGDPQVPANGNAPYAVIPSDCKIEDLSKFVYNEHRERPERARGTAKVLDGASFCEYFTLFRDANSRVFADETRGVLLAVLDHHESRGGAGSDPRWGQHRIELTMRASKEWQIWTGQDGKKQTQVEFAEFIEDNAPDIIQPPAAAMLEVARDLSAKTDVDFGSAIRLSDGSVQFKYSEQVRATVGAGQIQVPDQFDIAIPIYIGTERVRLTARLRYRINGGKLTFWYNLLRAEAAAREAFDAVRAAIGDTLSLTVINGTPG